MIPLIIACASGLAWLLTGRWLYGRWRGHQRGARECAEHGSPNRREFDRRHCCYDNASDADGVIAAAAMAAALFWPLVVLAALIRWHPPVADMERAEALTASQARVAELEAELGMKDGA